MKRLLLGVLSLLPLLSFGDQRSSELISMLSSTFGGYKQYEVQFTARVDQGAEGVQGRYVVSANRYYITADDRQIYSDGKQKYEVNDTDREVTIDVVNVSDKDILSNPTRAFEFVGGAYASTFKGEITYAGKKCYVVELLPTVKGSAIEQITLMIAAATGLPAGVKYRIDGVASAVEVTVNKITKLPTVSESLFVFDKNRHKGYEIIDFR